MSLRADARNWSESDLFFLRMARVHEIRGDGNHQFHFSLSIATGQVKLSLGNRMCGVRSLSATFW